MAIKTVQSTVTVPEVVYSKQEENRTGRITITTPKVLGAAIDAPANIAGYRIETTREVLEYRDGVEHGRTGLAFNPTIEQILAHPDGPTVLTLLPKILDDLYLASLAPAQE